MSKLRILHTLFLFCVFTAQAQFVFSGSVVDATNSEAIPFAHVKINDSTGVATDINGDFVFSDIAAGTYTVAISFVGYKPLTKSVKLKRKHTKRVFKLEVDALELSQVELVERHARQTNITRLRSVEGTAIYASKKNEVKIS